MSPMTPKEFNEVYELTYANYEEMLMNLMDIKVDGYWLNYSKGIERMQVVVTKKDNEHYIDTFKGDKLREIFEEIVEKYQIIY